MFLLLLEMDVLLFGCSDGKFIWLMVSLFVGFDFIFFFKFRFVDDIVFCSFFGRYFFFLLIVVFVVLFVLMEFFEEFLGLFLYLKRLFSWLLEVYLNDICLLNFYIYFVDFLYNKCELFLLVGFEEGGCVVFDVIGKFL